MKINIHEMLLENRHISVEENLNGTAENTTWKLWKVAMLNRTMMNIAPAGIKNKVVNKLFSKSWVAERGELHFAKKTFSQMWNENNQG